MSTRKVQATKNYRLFSRNEDNRPIDVKKHRKLRESMKAYGFLPCFPIVCVRNSKGNLIVKDGQHRLCIAEELALTVYWIEETIDFDVAMINCTAKVWATKDYAQKFASNGKHDYQIGLDFSEKYHISVGISFALLGGTTSFGNIYESFISGNFKIRDRKWAESVAATYGPLAAASAHVRNARMIEACMAACRVDGFDPTQLAQNAQRCGEKLQSYSTREAYLDMLEDIYNFGRSKKRLPLKFLATEAMHQRNAANPKKKAEDKQSEAA